MNTRIVMLAAALAATLAFAPGAAIAHDYKIGPIEVFHPWARATPKGATVASGYLKVTNTGAGPDRLSGGSAEIAGRVEIHEMATVDGIMRMRPLKNGVEIKPGQSIELKPGSYHVMLIGLKQPLQQGQKVKGTLTFEKAGTVDIEYAVGPIGGGAPSSSSSGGHRH